METLARSLRGLLTAMVLAAAAGPAFTQPPAAEGRRHAVLVGVSDYRASAELRRLPGATQDVTRLRDVLASGGYADGDITLMTTEGPAATRPTTAGIQAVLRDVLGRCRPEDTVVVAFAGHGLQFAGDQEQYFCPHDAVWENRETLIPLSRVYKALAECPAKRKLLLVDACRNDPLAETEDREEKAKTLAKGFTGAVPEAGDFIALFSCQAGQCSYEDRKLNHGVFFYHVIQALGGEAAGDDGTVTTDEFTAHVRQGTEKYVRTNFEAEQTPRLRVAGEQANFALVQPKALSDAQRLVREAIRLDGRGDPEAAVGAYDKALALDPRNAEAYYRRGVLKAKLGRHEDAAADFDLALEHRPDYIEAYLRRADANYALDERKSAVRDYTHVLAKRPDHPTALRDRAFVHILLHNHDKALADLNRLLDQDPDNASGYYYRSLLRVEQERPDDALADLDRAVAIDPHNTKYREERLGLMMAKKDDARVEQEEARLEQLAAYVPKTDLRAQERISEQSYAFGAYYQQAGRQDRAEQAFERSVQQSQQVYTRAVGRQAELEGLLSRGANRSEGATGLAARREARVAEQASRELEHMGALKSRSLQRLQDQAETARAAGNDRRAEQLERNFRNNLPTNLRKQYDQEVPRFRAESQQRIFGGSRAEQQQGNGPFGGSRAQPEPRQGFLGGQRNQPQPEPRPGLFGGRNQPQQQPQGGGNGGGSGRRNR